jgi:2-polyprenyl-3-methyl-5-hydroxy-6-metoxy-1,4-benzoquinol methylase
MDLYFSKGRNYFSAVRQEILDLVPAFSKRVLEVGCGTGQTLEMLKAKNLCLETVGFELFSAAAEEACSRVDNVYCLDVERDRLPGNLEKFDLILLLDVLEHLVDPWHVLKMLREEYLADEGKIIISLPNAQHFSLVLPLIFGRFNYEERGVLDKTHLRFFTRSSATDLLSSAFLKVDNLKRTSLDVSLNSGKLNFLTFGIFSNFIASQNIFLASKAAQIVPLTVM